MTSMQIRDEDFESAEGKVVLITGGASGIGRAAAAFFHSRGANVVIGDLNSTAGQQLASQLGSGCTFEACDVTVWSDLLHLFETAMRDYGRLDYVLANAGVPEIEDIFHDTFNEVTGKLQEPKYSVMAVNLISVLATSKLARHFFEKQKNPGAIILTSSTGGLCGEAYLPVYTTTKHGLMGLMRATSGRGDTPFAASNIRVNCVCPFMTDTGFMTKELLLQLKKTGTPINTGEAVARAMFYLATNKECSGKAIYIANNEYTEIEGPLRTTRPQWLGEANSRFLEPRFDAIS